MSTEGYTSQIEFAVIPGEAIVRSRIEPET